MNFQNPAALFALLPLAGVIVALYLLRMRRRDLVVPASFLWPERTDEVRANSLFQKLKFSWLLVLQLLALLALGMAWAQPQVKQKGLAGRITCVVLDASATMNTKDVGGKTRFERGKDLVDEMIGNAAAGDRLALVLAGPEPKVVFPLSSDPPRQRAQLKTAEGTDSDPDLGEALRLAGALVGSADSAKIVLISDGVFPAVENFSSGKAELVYTKVGSQSENLGIQGFGVSDAPQGQLVYIGVKNYGSQTRKAKVNITRDGKLADSQQIEVKPGQVWSKTAPAARGARVFEAKITSDDAYSVDDYAAALAKPETSLRVLLVGTSDFFLERALALEARVTLDKGQQVPAKEEAGSPGPGLYDLVIFHGVPEEPVKARGVLVFGAASIIGAAGGSTKNPSIASAEPHPVLKGVSFEGVYVDSIRKLTARNGGKSILDSGSGPIILAGEGVKRRVQVGFEPRNSDFPLQIGFPIFLANCLDWLTGSIVGAEALVQPGQSMAVSAQGTEIEAKGPTEFKTRASDGRAILRGLNRTGVYDLKGSPTVKKVHVALRSESESRIKPVDQLQIGSKAVAGKTAMDRLADIWKPLLLAVLMILAIEWWQFARRS